MTQKIPALLFFLVLVSVFGGLAIWDLKRSLEFLRASGQATAKLVTYEEDLISRDRTPRPAHRFHRILEFTLPSGERIQARDPQLGLDSATQFEQPISIRYLERDPKQVRVVQNEFELFTMAIVLAGAAVLSLLGGVLFLKG